MLAKHVGGAEARLPDAPRVAVEVRRAIERVSQVRLVIHRTEANARNAGLGNVETKVQDGEELDVPEGAFDAVISRVGLIYFPDQQRPWPA